MPLLLPTTLVKPSSQTPLALLGKQQGFSAPVSPGLGKSCHVPMPLVPLVLVSL